MKTTVPTDQRGTNEADVLSRKRVWTSAELAVLDEPTRSALKMLAVWFFLNRFADCRAYGFITGVPNADSSEGNDQRDHGGA